MQNTNFKKANWQHAADAALLGLHHLRGDQCWHLGAFTKSNADIESRHDGYCAHAKVLQLNSEVANDGCYEICSDESKVAHLDGRRFLAGGLGVAADGAQQCDSFQAADFLCEPTAKFVNRGVAYLGQIANFHKLGSGHYPERLAEGLGVELFIHVWIINPFMDRRQHV